ncbi:MAG: XkdF-like putative serine protease domain-containing protein [Dehalococcoidia bacterium]|nr:XkdF-like putative serine protease domain-containing protein [Dehalococcoidia bacterium]
MDKAMQVQIVKADSKRGVVPGWAIVCMKDGKPYYDLQKDYIPEDTMFDASLEFMRDSRVAGEMHKAAGEVQFDVNGKKVSGDVLYAFPMTGDVAKSLELETSQTGLLIGVHMTDKGVLKKFENGEYTGFSIEGKRLMQDILGDDGETVIKTEEFDQVRKSATESVDMAKLIHGAIEKGLKGIAKRDDVHYDSVMGNKAPSISTGRKKKPMSEGPTPAMLRSKALKKQTAMLKRLPAYLRRSRSSADLQENMYMANRRLANTRGKRFAADGTKLGHLGLANDARTKSRNLLTRINSRRISDRPFNGAILLNEAASARRAGQYGLARTKLNSYRAGRRHQESLGKGLDLAKIRPIMLTPAGREKLKRLGSLKGKTRLPAGTKLFMRGKKLNPMQVAAARGV